ncbi:hypothetical protein [Kitasatospora paranensis]|uniref:Uncharacterized protein n=1 Tax=Kitasatospora paranensis TaxID=258053 RepID=A0ABW2FUD3_9ACTN
MTTDATADATRDARPRQAELRSERAVFEGDCSASAIADRGPDAVGAERRDDTPGRRSAVSTG